MTAARDSTMTLVHRALAVRLEKEAKRHGLPDGWATVLIAASTSIKMLADAIDADLAPRDAVVSVDSGDVVDAVSKAMHRAWSLGQLYFQQADSESWSQNKKSDETQGKFIALVDETRAAIESLTSRKVDVPDGYKPTNDEVHAWRDRNDLDMFSLNDCRTAIDDARSMHMLASQDEVK